MGLMALVRLDKIRLLNEALRMVVFDEDDVLGAILEAQAYGIAEVGDFPMQGRFLFQIYVQLKFDPFVKYLRFCVVQNTLNLGAAITVPPFTAILKSSRGKVLGLSQEIPSELPGARSGSILLENPGRLINARLSLFD
jgi:hypothetical protein